MAWDRSAIPILVCPKCKGATRNHREKERESEVMVELQQISTEVKLDFTAEEFRNWLERFDPNQTLDEVKKTLAQGEYMGCPIDAFLTDTLKELYEVKVCTSEIRLYLTPTYSLSFHLPKDDWRARFIKRIDSATKPWKYFKMGEIIEVLNYATSGVKA